MLENQSEQNPQQEIFKQKREQFRINIRKTKIEEEFKKKREALLKSQQDQTLSQCELEKANMLIEQIEQDIMSKNFGRAGTLLELLASISEAHLYYQDLSPPANRTLENMIETKWYQNLRVFFEIVSDYDQFKRNLKSVMRLFMVFSLQSYDSTKFNGLEFFQDGLLRNLLIDLKDLNLFQITLTFIYNTLIDQNFALKLITEFDFPKLLNEIYELNYEMLANPLSLKLILQCTSVILGHSFPKKFDQFKDTIWFVVQFKEYDPEHVCEVLRLFTNYDEVNQDQIQSCQYLIGIDELLDFLFHQSYSHNFEAFATIGHIIQCGRRYLDILEERGVFQLFAKIVEDSRNPQLNNRRRLIAVWLDTVRILSDTQNMIQINTLFESDLIGLLFQIPDFFELGEISHPFAQILNNIVSFAAQNYVLDLIKKYPSIRICAALLKSNDIDVRIWVISFITRINNRLSCMSQFTQQDLKKELSLYGTEALAEHYYQKEKDSFMIAVYHRFMELVRP